MKVKRKMNMNAPVNKEKDENNEKNEEESVVSEQFEGILTTLGTMKTQLTALQQQVRCLQKAQRKETKSLKKSVEKNKRKGNRKPSGFAKPTQISEELSVFMSRGSGEEVARTEVTKFIIEYIREHDLQEKENRRIIRPDQKLTELLKVSKEDEVTYFNLQKYMNQHFPKKNCMY